MTRRPTNLGRLYSSADEGRRDREMKNACDMLSGKKLGRCHVGHVNVVGKTDCGDGCEVLEWTELVPLLY
jgi:hypothetical protein